MKIIDVYSLTPSLETVIINKRLPWEWTSLGRQLLDRSERKIIGWLYFNPHASKYIGDNEIIIMASYLLPFSRRFRGVRL